MKQINITYFTDMLPSIYNPTAGIFIYNRLKILKQYKNINLSAVKLSNMFYNKKYLSAYNLKQFDYEDISINVLNYFKYRHKGNFEFAADKLYKKYKKSKSNILHIHFAFPEGYIGYIVKKKYNTNYILTVHGSDIHTIPFKNINYKKMVLKALNNAKIVIFVSKYLFKKAKEIGYKKNNYYIIPNGIDLDKFYIIKRDIILKNINFKSNKIYIGYIGNLLKVKGVDKLPGIFNKISQAINNICFVIIGNGFLKENIKNGLSSYNLLDKTIFTGGISNDLIPYYLNAFDVLLIPSRNEGFPSILLECLACGTPVIASNVGGIPEILINNMYGYLVNLNDNFIENFSEQTLKTINKNWNRERIRKGIENYDWQNVIKKEIEIYKEIL
jgi:glycosyltransferase involved in cell wall biosynthesis